MQIIRASDSGFDDKLRTLIQRPPFDPAIEKAAADILADVRENGDDALCRCAKRFDHVALTPGAFRVTEAELTAASRSVSEAVRQAIDGALAQIREFSRHQRPAQWSYSPRAGVTLGERFAPLSRVGVYVPGGTAPLVSTVLHTVTLAAAAGVPEVAVVTPPRPDASVHPALLHACVQAGATEVYRLGGVYAIGALAYGTESVRPVEKIVGPGNAYVTAAKRQVYGYVALDLVAGPSEIMILADDTAQAAYAAADMLSQVEHGSGAEQAVLITTSDRLISEVQRELAEQIDRRTRRDSIRKCLDTGVAMVLVDSLDQAADIASAYAPEHLEIMTRHPEELAEKVTAAGAMFLGHWTPEPVGDFVAGPSHVLPTGGAGRYFSGLTVDQFYRRISVVKYERNALEREADMLRTFAQIEGLDAHGESTAIRLKNASE